MQNDNDRRNIIILCLRPSVNEMRFTPYNLQVTAKPV
jgi:hypothetical protein